MGDLGWCKDPYTTPSMIRYASKGQDHFQSPVWPESWFPDAFIGTMAQLLIALESGREPAISGRDNLKTMALVEAAYLSAAQFRSIEVASLRPMRRTPEFTSSTKPAGFLKKFFSPQNPTYDLEISNFTPRAQQVLALARKEADLFNHNFVGTEHLLLGLIRLGQGVAVTVLLKLGLDLETVRIEVKKQVGVGPDEKMIGNIPYTPRVKRILALAAKEAKALNHTYVGTEHILLGLLREGEGVASRVLQTFGVETERTRQEILKELDPNFGK